MSWFFFVLPLMILYVAAALFNHWPVESLWVLAVMVAGPVWMFLKEVMPKVFQNTQAKYNMIHFLQKNSKKKDSEIQRLKLEIADLNRDLSGLHKMWLQSKSTAGATPKQTEPKQFTEPKESPLEKLIELPYATSKKIVTEHKLQNYNILENEIYDVIEMAETSQGKHVAATNSAAELER